MKTLSLLEFLESYFLRILCGVSIPLSLWSGFSYIIPFSFLRLHLLSPFPRVIVMARNLSKKNPPGSIYYYYYYSLYTHLFYLILSISLRLLLLSPFANKELRSSECLRHFPKWLDQDWQQTLCHFPNTKPPPKDPQDADVAWLFSTDSKLLFHCVTPALPSDLTSDLLPQPQSQCSARGELQGAWSRGHLIWN